MVKVAITAHEENMNLKQIENEALQLSEEERAELAHKLILSLDSPSQEEIEDSWLAEAFRRAQELDDGIVQPIPAEEVRKKGRLCLDELHFSTWCRGIASRSCGV